MRNRILMALCAVFVLTSAPALADDDRRGRGRGDGQWYQGHDHKHDGKHYKKRGDKHHKEWRHKERRHSGWHRGHGRAVVIWQGHRHWSPPPRHYHHHYKPRPPRHVHHHYGHRRGDRDDWALYAILALQLVDVLNESQQQSYAWAQQRAVAAPIGETIQWQDSGLYGSVTPVRDGADAAGRYCREFQHQITVGNRLQSGYGIACRQPDGAWEIVS